MTGKENKYILTAEDKNTFDILAIGVFAAKEVNIFNTCKRRCRLMQHLNNIVFH